MAHSSIVVIDFETTGLSANSGDRVVEVGLVRLDRSLRVEREYGTLVNPECPVGATRIHGITDADVAAAPTFRDIAGDVGEMLEDAVLAGHNATFDMRFLWSEFEHVGLGRKLPDEQFLHVVDTLGLAHRFVAGVENYKLGTVCAACGIAEWGHHGALGDARATAQLLAHLVKVGGENLREEVFQATGVLSAGWAGRRPSGRSLPRRTLATLSASPEGRATPTSKPPPLTGEVAVITGGTGITREEAVKAAEMLGCTIRNSVTGKTTIVVVGDPGDGRWTQHSMDKTGKHREAEERVAAGQPIRILTVDEFLRLAQACSDSIITDEEWLAVRELVHGPGHERVPMRPPPKPRRPRTTRPQIIEEPLVLPEVPEWPSALFLRARATAAADTMSTAMPAFAALFEMDLGQSTAALVALGDSPDIRAFLRALHRHVEGSAGLLAATVHFLGNPALGEEFKAHVARSVAGAVAAGLRPGRDLCAAAAGSMKGAELAAVQAIGRRIEGILASL